MNAADVGDDDFFAERGQVDDVVDAGAEGLDPFELRRFGDDMVGHWRREAHQHFGVGDIGADVVMMADHVDGQLRKPFQEHGLVAGPHRFLDFGKNEEIWHAGWYNAKRRQGK